MLTSYIAQTNRLLQNPVPATPLYSTADLTVYVNTARQQLAADAQCIRASSSASLTPAGQIYPFSLFNVFTLPAPATGSIFFPANPSPGDTITLNSIALDVCRGHASRIPNPDRRNLRDHDCAERRARAQQLARPDHCRGDLWCQRRPATATLTITYKTTGSAGNAYTLAASAATPSGATLTGGTTILAGISSVIALRQLSVTVGGVARVLVNRPWPWFNRFFLANGVATTTGTPTTWSQQAVGSSGTFGIGPPPPSAYTITADAVCLPIDLVDNTTTEAIPYPYTDAVSYYAAYMALLSSQRTTDATVMFQRYQQFVKRAVEMSAPPVYPMNFQGGMGAQMVASKQGVTETAPPQRGGQ
jgi:hypothetical protein